MTLVIGGSTRGLPKRHSRIISMLRLTDWFLIAILAFIAITAHRLLIIWFAEYVSYRYEVKWSRRQKPNNILPMAMALLPLVMSILKPSPEPASDHLSDFLRDVEKERSANAAHEKVDSEQGAQDGAQPGEAG